ncbi:hypothetical protein RCL1_008517 [Eukaryota sp. TZLM3-RCL]
MDSFSSSEQRKFLELFQSNTEFRDLFLDYANKLSDPKVRKENEDMLCKMEELSLGPKTTPSKVSLTYTTSLSTKTEFSDFLISQSLPLSRPSHFIVKLTLDTKSKAEALRSKLHANSDCLRVTSDVLTLETNDYLTLIPLKGVVIKNIPSFISTIKSSIRLEFEIVYPKSESTTAVNKSRALIVEVESEEEHVEDQSLREGHEKEEEAKVEHINEPTIAAYDDTSTAVSEEHLIDTKLEEISADILKESNETPMESSCPLHIPPAAALQLIPWFWMESKSNVYLYLNLNETENLAVKFESRNVVITSDNCGICVKLCAPVTPDLCRHQLSLSFPGLLLVNLRKNVSELWDFKLIAFGLFSDCSINKNLNEEVEPLGIEEVSLLMGDYHSAWKVF